MSPAAYQAALDAYLATLSAGAVGDRKRLLVATSEPFTNTDLHRTLEDAGALVVAEDDWWGARAPGDDPSGGTAEAVFRKAWLDTATSQVWPAADRDGWLQQQAARADVDAVVFYIPPSDHQFGWDYPRLNAAAEALGKPTLLIRHDASGEAGRVQIRAQVAGLLGAKAA
jgi:benzoyl-CoA reductase/2-hydroxyglutaryl-CoA dehydratase subunit BcrC/BadD/HgdB